MHFRKVVGRVIVDTVASVHRQALGLAPCADKLVLNGFAGALGAGELVGVGFGK